VANILDDLFQWAGQQPVNNISVVQVSITTNEITRNNLVSFGEGALTYHPAHSVGMLLLPATFSSANDGITQYFSDRRYGGGQGPVKNYPFDANKTDPLTMLITKPYLMNVGYTVTFKSSKWGFTESFMPSFDAVSSVLFGPLGGGFVTISLCNRNSAPQIP